MQHEPAQLLVIDEDESTHAIIPILEQCGYNLTVVPDEASTPKFEQSEFDVIIRGSTACHSNTPLSIRFFRKTPILVATRNDDTEDVIKCLELGAADYIGLPSHSTIIKARIEGYAERVKHRKRDRHWVRVVAHDIRTPIILIRGYAEILLAGYEQQLSRPLTEKQKECVETIKRSAMRLSGWIENITDMLNYESGIRQLYFETLQLDAVLQSVIRTIQSQIEGKNQTLVLDIPQNLPHVRGELSPLKQVMFCLLTNANLYTPAGGQIKVTVNSEPLEGVVHVAVSDTGIGIAPENQPKIFQPFYRVFDPKVMNPKAMFIPKANNVFGYGLGLAIAKGIIEAHGGRIWFESTPDVGSTFHFTVPMAQEQK